MKGLVATSSPRTVRKIGRPLMAGTDFRMAGTDLVDNVHGYFDHTSHCHERYEADHVWHLLFYSTILRSLFLSFTTTSRPNTYGSARSYQLLYSSGLGKLPRPFGTLVPSGPTEGLVLSRAVDEITNSVDRQERTARERKKKKM